MRSGLPTLIIPELPYPDLREPIEWLCRVFGFVERLRIADHRAQLTLGDGSLVVTKWADGSNSSFAVMAHVNDVDSHYKHVKNSSAHIIAHSKNYPYGERQYVVEDIGGYHWTFSQTLADVDPVTWGGMLLA